MDTKGILEAIKTLLQMEFMQLEFVQEEIKDQLDELKDKSIKFDQEFELETEKVNRCIYNVH